MTDLRTAAQQALEALEDWDSPMALPAVVALRAALAQQAEPVEPVQQPYCYVYEYDGAFGLHREFYPKVYNGHKPDRTVPVYTAPPQRKPLTDEEIAAEWQKASECASKSEGAVTTSQFVQMFARAVERAHGIKE